MAKIPQGILGGISGKIGGVVGSSWKGINVIKTKPLSVANPKTAGQMTQRNLFGNSVLFAAIILATVIKPLWDRFASKQSGFNAFIQANLSYFTDPVPLYDSGFAISKGKMDSTAISTLTKSTPLAGWIVTWANDSGIGYKLATDVAYVVIYKTDGSYISGFETTAVRSAGTVYIASPQGVVTTGSVNAFLAFRRADGTIVSNSSSKNAVLV